VEEEIKTAPFVTTNLEEEPSYWTVLICIINAVWNHLKNLILLNKYVALCADTRTIKD